MRILVVSNNHFGGAGIAAYRLHKALLEAGEDSKMMVAQRRTDDPTVLPVCKYEQRFFFWRTQFEHLLKMAQRPANQEERSLALLGSRWIQKINASDADVVNLHSVNRGMLSIKNIVEIKKPVVWTLHDMWAFCGAEHYADDGPDARWRSGYTRENRVEGDKGLDLDALTWQRKRKLWKRRLQLVSPSRWLAEHVKQSALMKDWPVEVIPNPLDLRIFSPQDKTMARQTLNLPLDKPILLFGSLGSDPSGRKGFDLLLQALNCLAERIQDIHLVVFGQSQPEEQLELPYPVHWMGRIEEESQLAQLYSSADVMVVPSRMDNAPQTATEAVACGCPVVGFKVGGLVEIVEHGTTGYLANPFNVDELADWIAKIVVYSKGDYELHASSESYVRAGNDFPRVTKQWRERFHYILN